MNPSSAVQRRRSSSRRLAWLAVACGACMTAFACSAPGESKPAGPAADDAKPTSGQAVDPAAARRAPVKEVELIVRVYPIADIVAPPTRPPTATPTDRLFGGGGGGGGGAMITPGEVAATEDAERAARMTRFINTLQSLIAADSWTDNGGLIGAIQVVDDSLLIRQTPENHKQIEDLLASLRKSATPIRLSVKWVQLSATGMDRASEPVGTVRLLRKSEEGFYVTDMPQYVLDQIELSAYSGDPLLATSGTGIPYVSDLEPVVGNGAVGFDPTISMIDTGASLRGAAYVLPGGEVRLDLVAGHVTLTEMATASAGVAGAVIQTPHVADRTMAIRMTAPLGKPVVVGAVSANTGTTQPSDGKMIYLVITVEAVPAK